MDSIKFMDTKVGFGVYDEKGREYGVAIRIHVGRISYEGSCSAWNNTNANDPNVQKCPLTGSYFYKTFNGKIYRMPTRKKFSVTVHVTRAGNRFGGTCSLSVDCETLEEAETIGKAKAEAMRKSYVAKVAKSKSA